MRCRLRGWLPLAWPLQPHLRRLRLLPHSPPSSWDGSCFTSAVTASRTGLSEGLLAFASLFTPSEAQQIRKAGPLASGGCSNISRSSECRLRRPLCSMPAPLRERSCVPPEYPVLLLFRL